MKKIISRILVIVMMVVACGMSISPIEASAAADEIKLTNGFWSANMYLMPGESQRVRSYTTAEYRELKTQYSKLQWSYMIEDPTIASVEPAASNMSAMVTGLSLGSTNLNITCTGIPKDGSDDRITVFYAHTYINVYPDLTGLTLGTSSIDALLGAYDIISESIIDINFPEGLEVNQEIPVSITSDNDQMLVSAAYMKYDKKVKVECSTDGEANLEIKVGNVICPVHIVVKRQGLSDYTKLLAPGKSSRIKMLNYDGAVKFSSLQPKVVSCSEDGKIKALKQGNAVIVADLDNGEKIGCVVSVVPTKIIKVCKKAAEIGATCEYSMDKRMTPGYYDCSSLTYLAYKSQGYKLCNFNGWAPTSRDQAKWCKKNNRFIKGALSDKNVQKMKLLPGDLMFEYRIKGDLDSMYHVEMITGYVVCYFDASGNPVLGIAYANRYPNYYAHGANQYIGRPYLDM